jgi:hypothetical protein
MSRAEARFAPIITMIPATPTGFKGVHNVPKHKPLRRIGKIFETFGRIPGISFIGVLSRCA